jgi:hypothetical protein
MDKTVEHMLIGLADICPRLTAGAEDWQRLYELTLYAHRNGLKIHHRTIRDYLVKHGCSVQKATWLGTQFRYFTELLTLYEQQRIPKDDSATGLPRGTSEASAIRLASMSERGQGAE